MHRAAAVLLLAVVVLPTACIRRPSRVKTPPKPVPGRPPPPAPLTIEEVETRASGMVKTLEFGASIRYLDDMIRLRSDWKDRLDRVKEAVLVSARAEYNSLDARAKAELERGDAVAAIHTWEETGTWDVPEIATKARSEILKASDVERAHRFEMAIPMLRPILREVRPLVVAHEFREASDLCLRAGRDNPEVGSDLDWLVVTMTEAPLIVAGIKTGLGEMDGQKVELRDGTATLGALQNDVVAIRREGSESTGIRVLELPPGVLIEAARRGAINPVQTCRLLLSLGHREEARALCRDTAYFYTFTHIVDLVDRAMAEEPR